MKMGACRLVDTNEEDILTISQIFADKICTKFTQHAIVIIEGKTGSGKSTAALDIAYKCSVEFAIRLGGIPTDYFEVDTHTAIISPEEVVTLAKNLKRYGIYILDDIGIALGARNWQSEINSVLTGIMQTFRTQQNLLIMTAPDRNLVDKIARNLAHFKIVMTESHFRKGITIGKLSTVHKIYQKDSGANIYPYIRHKNVCYNHAVFHLPPQSITYSYEKRRHDIEEEIREKSIEEFKENTLIADAKKKDKLEKAKEGGNSWVDKMVNDKILNPEMTAAALGRKYKKSAQAVSYQLNKRNLNTNYLSATV